MRLLALHIIMQLPLTETSLLSWLCSLLAINQDLLSTIMDHHFTLNRHKKISTAPGEGLSLVLNTRLSPDAQTKENN